MTPTFLVEADSTVRMTDEMCGYLSDNLARWASEEPRRPLILSEGLTLRHIAEDGTIEPRVIYKPDAFAVRLVAGMGLLGMAVAFVAGFFWGVLLA